MLPDSKIADRPSSTSRTDWTGPGPAEHVAKGPSIVGPGPPTDWTTDQDQTNDRPGCWTAARRLSDGRFSPAKLIGGRVAPAQGSSEPSFGSELYELRWTPSSGRLVGMYQCAQRRPMLPSSSSCINARDDLRTPRSAIK